MPKFFYLIDLYTVIPTFILILIFLGLNYSLFFLLGFLIVRLGLITIIELHNALCKLL